MSKIALSGNASGTGTLTIAAPNTDSDRTIDLPDAAGTVFVSGQALSATTGSFSSDVTLGSSVLATPSGSAPSYTCRAWVNFRGTSTVAIRASGNVSSVTDLGTGSYQVNLTTAMPDTDYAVFRLDHYYGVGWADTQTTTSYRVYSANNSFNLFDVDVIWSAVFR